MNTVVRQANIDDLEAVAVLFDEYRVFYRKESDIKGAKAFLKDRITKRESEIFMVEAENQAVGFTQLYPLFSSTNMKRLWLLNDLYIKPDFRGKGLSVLLINKAKALALETDSAGVMLETEKSNGIGNQLYPRTGFELDQEHNFYFWSC